MILDSESLKRLYFWIFFKENSQKWDKNLQKKESDNV